MLQYISAGVSEHGSTWSGGTTWAGSKSLTGTANLAGNTLICGDLRLTGDVTIDAPSGAVLYIENGLLDLQGYKLQTASGSAVTIVFTGTNTGSYQHYPTDNSAVQMVSSTSRHQRRDHFRAWRFTRTPA